MSHEEKSRRDWDYYCSICEDWYEWPAGLDHCPNCGHEHDDEVCPECGYDGEMELICPECGIDGGNGGLTHACCCEREIEVQHPELRADSDNNEA